MRKRLMAGLIVAVVGWLAYVPAAWARSTPTNGAHFTNSGDPSCTLNADTTASCTAELAGLGEGDILITTSVGGTAVYQCQNKGGNVAPGQNKVLVGPETNPVVLPGGEVDNGRAVLIGFTDEPLEAPATVSGREAGCPNGNWTGVNPTVSITSVTFSASQGGVLLFDCGAEGDNLAAGTVPLECTDGVAV